MSEVKSEEFKKSYTYIFSFFYLVQGLYNGIQWTILPIYLIMVVKTIEIAVILSLFSISIIPWTLKFFIGLINDKYGTKRFGRRKPWIFIFGIWAGISFIVTGIGLYVVTRDSIIGFAIIGSLMWNIGIAIADTALDGLILDVTPKEKLGKVQGYTWSMNLLGGMGGGIVLGAIFLIFNIIPIFFILVGVLLFFACFFPFFIKESEIPNDVKILKNLKIFLKNRTNWQVFSFSFIDSIPYGIVGLIYGLLVIIYMPNSPIKAEVTSLTLVSESLDLFIMFSILGAISGIGVIAGCIITGRIADKNRRWAVYFAQIMYIPFLCVSVFFREPFLLGILMIIILGTGQGAITTSYQAIRGDIAKQYPEVDSTYYALVISFLNSGQMVGYAFSAFLLTLFSTYYSEFYIIYFWIIIIMAGFQTLSFIIFMTINPEKYEFAHHIQKNSRIS